MAISSCRMDFKKSIFLLLLVSVMAVFVYENRHVSIRVCGDSPENDFEIEMPYRDQRKLEAFFRHLCIVELWSYTLIGAKPVTFYGLDYPTLSGFFKHPFYFFKNWNRISGWETWLKYKHYFSNSHFQTLEDHDPKWDDRFWIVIVDTQNFSKTIKENEQDFYEVLGARYRSPSDMLKEATKYSFLGEVLKGHDALIGIVLGYGKENSWAFYEQQEVDSSLSVVWEEEILEQMIHKLSPKDWNLEPWDLTDLFYPSFAGVPGSEETERLRHHYREAHDQIVRHYEGEDFLEATLSLFASAGNPT